MCVRERESARNEGGGWKERGRCCSTTQRHRTAPSSSPPRTPTHGRFHIAFRRRNCLAEAVIVMGVRGPSTRVLLLGWGWRSLAHKRVGAKAAATACNTTTSTKQSGTHQHVQGVPCHAHPDVCDARATVFMTAVDQQCATHKDTDTANPCIFQKRITFH